MAVWLNTHWTSRPTVTTWSNGQTGRSNQRWTPGDRGGLESAPRPARPGSAPRSSPGRRPRTRSNGTASDHEVGGDRLARAERHALDAPVRRPRRPPRGRRSSGGRRRPARRARSRAACRRARRAGRGDLHPEPLAVAEEAVEEDLAGVADVHLVEPLVSAETRTVAQYRLIVRTVWPCLRSQSANDSPGRSSAARTEAGQAVGDPELVAPAQVIGPEEAAGQVERGGQGARPELRGPPVGAEEDDAPARGGRGRWCRPAGRSRRGSCSRPC